MSESIYVKIFTRPSFSLGTGGRLAVTFGDKVPGGNVRSLLVSCNCPQSSSWVPVCEYSSCSLMACACFLIVLCFRERLVKKKKQKGEKSHERQRECCFL